uniref:Ribosomal protein S20 n=1 Tax=Halydictyon mirabile TaxID=189652 RepID=A0A4D6WZ86_9FLOR|nr:ribosomal protein S20 [Halydictyon mirabile]
MPKNLSAIKRVQIGKRNRLQNKKYKLLIKKSIKKYLLSIKNNNNQFSSLSNVYKCIDKAIKHKIIHKNKGARKKSKLAKMINN